MLGLDVTAHLDGYALRLDGEVLMVGSLTACARALTEMEEWTRKIDMQLAALLGTERTQ